MNVAHVLPDSGRYCAVLPGTGGMCNSKWQLTHWISRPDIASSHWKCCPQCGHANLNSLIFLGAVSARLWIGISNQGSAVIAIKNGLLWVFAETKSMRSTAESGVGFVQVNL